MNRSTAADLSKRLEHHRIQLQQLEKELATSGGKRDEDSEAARDLRQAILALARTQSHIAPRAQLSPLIWEPSAINPVPGL